MQGDLIPDEDLIALYRQGDKSACEELLIRYKNKALALARRFSLVGCEADDLAQEGMLGLYSAVMNYVGETPFQPYANACIRNRILDAVRSRGNVREGVKFLPFIDEGEGDMSDGASPEDALVSREAMKELLGVLKSSLSELEYAALKAYYIDGATMAEITSALNVTYKQADNALSRAKSKLKKRMEKGGK